MTRRRHRGLGRGTGLSFALPCALSSALLLALLPALAGVGAGTSYADGGSGSARTAVSQTKRVVVKWEGRRSTRKKKARVYQRTTSVPGIGQVDLVCKPQSTMVRIRPSSRRPETQMWMAKFEQKGGRDVVAVKNVRVYTYATADDDGTGGTGSRAHEGLNQRSPIEDFQKGSAYGVISQRPGRDQDGGGAVTTPVTSFKLTWWWERFRHPGYQYCKMALTLRTDTARQFALSWHGDDEAVVRHTSTTTIPGVGEAIVTCEPGSNAHDQSVAFRPPAASASSAFLDFEYVQGEGDVDDQVDHYDDLDVDPETGLLGPVELPRNGIMRLWVSVGGVKRAYVLSSYYVVNNAAKPWLNTCEVAATPLP